MTEKQLRQNPEWVKHRKEIFARATATSPRRRHVGVGRPGQQIRRKERAKEKKQQSQTESREMD